MIKFIYYLVPIVMLAIFVLSMNMGHYLKEPRGDFDNVPKYFEVVETDLTEGNWDMAKDDLEKLENAWEAVIPRIQFDAERDEINRLSISLTRMKGAIKAQEKGGALMELEEAREHWEELEK
jgi:hypothetical protein